ncbi:MAG: hypothetical protein ACYC47_09505 [Desulfobacteria bacterium]
MKSGSRNVEFVILSVLLTALLAVGDVLAAGPVWMPGFPLRAGATVILMWGPVPGATEYKLLKKTGEADFKEVYKGPMNNFSDPDAPSTVTIEYKVVPVVKGKEGDPSSTSVLKGIEPLKSPAFTGFLTASDTITVRWTNPPGSMFFNLYRADKKGGAFALVGSIQQETYTDRNVKKGTTYYYQVTAVDRNNTESKKSPVLEAVLKEEVKVVELKEVVKKVVSRGAVSGEDLYEFVQPNFVGVLKDGRVYVVDRTSIQYLDKDGKYLSRLNLDPKWSPPNGAAVDRDGKMLLAFLAEKVVRKIDESGKAVETFSYPPLGGKFVNNPNYVAVDGDGNYWITDGVRFQVVKLDPAGKQVEVLGRLRGAYDFKTKKETDFPGVGKIYYNPYDGKLYVVLGVDAVVRVVDPKTSRVVKTFGGIGPNLDQFSGVGGLAFRKNGNILVLDHLSQTVKEFSKDYKYLATYADVLEKKPSRLSTNFPSGLGFNEELNRFYVLSTLGNVVYVFDIPNG